MSWGSKASAGHQTSSSACAHTRVPHASASLCCPASLTTCPTCTHTNNPCQQLPYLHLHKQPLSAPALPALAQTALSATALPACAQTALVSNCPACRCTDSPCQQQLYWQVHNRGSETGPQVSQAAAAHISSDSTHAVLARCCHQGCQPGSNTCWRACCPVLGTKSHLDDKVSHCWCLLT